MVSLAIPSQPPAGDAQEHSKLNGEAFPTSSHSPMDDGEYKKKKVHKGPLSARSVTSSFMFEDDSSSPTTAFCKTSPCEYHTESSTLYDDSYSSSIPLLHHGGERSTPREEASDVPLHLPPLYDDHPHRHRQTDGAKDEKEAKNVHGEDCDDDEAMLLMPGRQTLSPKQQQKKTHKNNKNNAWNNGVRRLWPGAKSGDKDGEQQKQQSSSGRSLENNNGYRNYGSHINNSLEQPLSGSESETNNHHQTSYQKNQHLHHHGLRSMLRSLIPFIKTKSSGSLPQEEQGRSTSSNHSLADEESYLLRMEEGSSSSVSHHDDEDGLDENKTALAAERAKAKHHWGKISEHVHSGNALLVNMLQQPSTFGPNNNEGSLLTWDEANESGIDSLREKAQAVIRNGIEFNLQQCVAAMLLYIAVAILAFSFVFDHWTIIDSIYFAIVTFTTVGYGDLVPDSSMGRIFTVFYAFSGVACLGIAIGVLGTNVVEAQEAAVQRASNLAKTRVMTFFDSSPDATMELENEEADLEAEEKRLIRQEGPFRQLAQTFAVVLIILIVFACLVAKDPAIGVSWVDAFYYTIITATTVGFGDYAPETQYGRLLAIVFIPVSVGAMGHFLSIVASAIMELRRTRFQRQMESRELSVLDLELMDTDADGQVSQHEFLEFMLLAMNKVDKDFIEEMRGYFKRLDADGTGTLSRDDLIENARRKLAKGSKKLELSDYKRKLLRRAKAAGQGGSELRNSFWGRLSLAKAFEGMSEFRE